MNGNDAFNTPPEVTGAGLHTPNPTTRRFIVKEVKPLTVKTNPSSPSDDYTAYSLYACRCVLYDQSIGEGQAKWWVAAGAIQTVGSSLYAMEIPSGLAITEPDSVPIRPITWIQIPHPLPPGKGPGKYLSKIDDHETIAWDRLRFADA